MKSPSQPGADAVVSSAKPRPGVSLRAIVFSLVLVPLNSLLMMRLNYVLGWAVGAYSLFGNAVALLTVFVLVNQVLKRRRPDWAFSAGELLTMYSVVVIASGFMSTPWDLGGSLAGTITYPFWFATSENGWQQRLWPHLPTWLTIRDRSVLEGFYVGQSSPYRWAVISAWLVPALCWTVLIGTLMGVALCLNVVFRRRWQDEEKLAFPIIALPIHLVEDRLGLFKSRLFWIGIGASVLIASWNSVVSFIPTLPAIPSFYSYAELITQRPWNMMRYSNFSFGLWEFGLCFLMPLDLTLSLIIMCLFWDAQLLFSGQMGWGTSGYSGFPFVDQQGLGGVIAVAIAFLWLDRRYLGQAARRALGMSSALDDATSDDLSYRAAMLGALGGLALLWWMLTRAGMEGWVAAVFLIGYAVIALTICRFRAQVGPPSHEMYHESPELLITSFMGTGGLRPETMGMFSLLRPFLLNQRNHPAPGQLEALAMAEGGRMNRRRLTLFIGFIGFFTMLCYFWACMHVGYAIGLGTGKAAVGVLDVPRYTAGDFDGVLRTPTPPNLPGAIAFGAGVIMTLLLMWLKIQFAWWPIHPVAFPISLAWGIHGLLPAMVFIYVLKAVLLRFGGLKANRTATPLFLGFLVGSAGYSWSIGMLVGLLR